MLWFSWIIIHSCITLQLLKWCEMCRTCLILGLFLLVLSSPARLLAASSVFFYPVGAGVVRHIWLRVSWPVMVSTVPSLSFPFMSVMLRPAQFISLVQWVFLVKVIYGVVGGEGGTLRTPAGVPVPAPLVPVPHTGADPLPGFKVGFPVLGQPPVGSLLFVVPPVVSVTGVLAASGMGRPVPRGPARPHAVAPVRPTGRPRGTVCRTTWSEARTVGTRTQRTTDWAARSCTFWEVPTQTSSGFETMIKKKKNLFKNTNVLSQFHFLGLILGWPDLPVFPRAGHRNPGLSLFYSIFETTRKYTAKKPNHHNLLVTRAVV